ncbi:pyruvate dehydrogenase (acetyl-transferring) E1 component subunit alpha [Desulfopila sp. IMCC35006]|uniref:pyruvate dehydrogenase (acetyl-transferring) E1 component subunit alpha n=1 Tax=Desulfopila sp. IMCC35006 TaxID=2569542 RepID=UPI0010ACE9B8|nr:pyruvate dehydrogenase (acetyl-transferring) E1 component subunit alpha [Desulfopila sp. IMCC35006]TKB26863.1 pyruvate dehydrogenase (acetyl-transferring) E1 component subunit alpha [Desulfopila sp. IMCC35006]
MGRKHLALTNNIDHLSILDENGILDLELEPEITNEAHLKMLHAMLLGRRFDERMLDLQRQGRIGTFPPIKGQEAAQIGTVALLRDSDWLVPAFRETAAEIMRGRSMESVLLYYNGYNEGTIIAEKQRDMPMSVPVASQILHAVGLGLAAQYRKTEEVVMTFFGDGATSEGDFHEGLNCAAVYQAPVIFVCQNNQWAISVPLARQTHSETLAQKALAYGMPGIQIDGNDILAVHAATAEAVDRARSGGGPTFIECVTYRVMMHTTADDPRKYRSEEEVEAWKKKDPLLRYQQYLLTKDIVAQNDLDALEAEIKQQIQTAIDRAEEQMQKLGEPLAMFDHLYAELPASLAKQRAELAHELDDIDREVDHG